MTSMTKIVADRIPPGRLAKKCSTTSSPPNPRKTKENTAAPIRIKNTIDVTLAVPWATSRKRVKFRRPLRAASKIAPHAPTPAASVGVAAPARIEPNTAIIKQIGGSKFFKALKRCASSE